MPYTFNGIGTWYYGKKNLHDLQDTCEHCGAYANLSSYDTTKYFVFVYLPILPLGKYRVLNDCDECRQHSSLWVSTVSFFRAIEIGCSRIPSTPSS